MTEYKKRLAFRQRLAYGVGHVLNDLCAGMWFCYLLVFFHNVVHFNHALAGYLMLLGQLVDGLCTPFVGFGADHTKGFCKYGKRKSWHIVGTICVVFSFPFCFNDCIGCQQVPEMSKFAYYVPFIVIFQFGWAATQISHLSLIPDLTANESERVELNAIRYAFTGLSNITVYLSAWLLFHTDSGDPRADNTSVNSSDAPKFRNLAFIVVGVGAVFSVLFHVGTHEGTQVEAGLLDEDKSPDKIPGMTWSMWLKEHQFYQIGIIYMCSRLIVNLTQVYAAMFLTETLNMNKEHIATVPLVVFLSGFLVSFIMKPTNKVLGRKSTYLVGVLFVIASCIWMWIIQPQIALQMFGAAILLGIGNSTLLVTSLSMTADLIGNHVESGAFVYGAMSFTDKLSNGVAVALLQQMQPCMTETRCADSAWYYRDTMVVVPGVTAFVAVLAVITLLPQKLGSLRHDSKHQGEGSREQKERDPEKQPLILHFHKGDLSFRVSGGATAEAKGLTAGSNHETSGTTRPTTTA